MDIYEVDISTYLTVKITLKTFKGIRLFRKGEIIPVENTGQLGQKSIVSTGIMTPATKIGRFSALTVMGECTGECT